MTATQPPATILGMDSDADDDLADFLARYADACADAGVAPLPPAALAELAEALLTGTAIAESTLH
jgi:hypothetical protein